MNIARIHEIFTSIQGEGVFSGKRQIFARFFGCNLNCAFCDTPQQPQDAKEYSEEDFLFAINQAAMPGSVHSVSLTGGEPLLQAGFLKAVLPKLKQSGYRIYLETNGTLPDKLPGLIDYTDIIAMDIKLPSSNRGGDFWDEHSAFLSIAIKKQVFVKVVVAQTTTYKDIYRAISILSHKDPYIAFVLQPVSPRAGVEAVDAIDLENFRNIASEHLHHVKVIPQMHRLYGVR